ncbi:isoprenoid synthase domain-containing protein [Pisolithus albus]|nr:isoprenoid synthase domain-containing protein [Pisolithus albus]KAI5988051.1 isoprenoid synthase domain-containing protein [Pisolithus albus]
MPLSTFENILSILNEPPELCTSDNEKHLLGPFTYIASNPGKDIRGTLIAAFNIWLNVPKSKLDVITRVIDMVHNASLMLDDIEDESELRRGKPAAHMVYGIPQTINSASYACWLAYQQLSSIQEYPAESTETKGRLLLPEALDQIFREELLHFHRGQGLDIIWRDTFRCPTEQEYIQMARGKACSILRLSVKIMMAFATTNTDINYVHLVDLFGIYGQIRDDYMNLQSKEYTDTKGLADDISEGKFSFPVIHGIREKPENTLILDILKQRPKTPTLKCEAVAYLKDTTHSFDYTLSAMRSLERLIREETAKLGGNQILETLLERLRQ